MDLLSLLNRRLLSRRLVARFFQLYFQLFRILPIIPFLLSLEYYDVNKRDTLNLETETEG